MSYDLNKWVEHDLQRGKRHRWVRWLLGIGIGSAILIAILTPFDRNADPRDFATAFPWLLILLAGLYYSPFARDVWAGTGTRAAYDEFERDALRKATVWSYHLTVALVVALVLWSWLGALYDVPRPVRPYDWSAVLLAMGVTAGTLPALIAEILVPIPPIDDEEEG